MARLKCFPTCRECANGIFLKYDFWGLERLYTCPYHSKKKHKKVWADDCGYFRCKEYGEYSFCKGCRGK